jgi:hypothetical protein
MGNRGLRHFVLLMGAIVLGLVGSPGALAQTDAVEVSVKPSAELVGGGEAVTVEVRVRCDPGLEVLEANLSVSQGDASGFTGFGGITCNGRRQTRFVTVSTFGALFAKGQAFASAFVLVIDPDTQETQQGQDSRSLRIR